MNQVTHALVQCWGCPIFDRLFQIISYSGAVIYRQMSEWAWLILVGFWVFYVAWIVWVTMKDEESKDWMYQKSIKPVLINSLVVCGLLGMGIYFPKFITTITMEPVTTAATVYAQAVTQFDTDSVNQKVEYQPQKMDDTGIFRPELRDKIILLMKTSITRFQALINFGLAVVDKAFDWKVLIGLVVLIASNFIPFLGWFIQKAVIIIFFKNLLMLGLGLYIIYQFFKLFLGFCYKFIDVIVSLAMFAFFFPFMLVLSVVQRSSSEDWVKSIGGGFSLKLVRNTFSSIVSLMGAVLVYTVIIVMVANFFSSDLFTNNEIARHVMDGTINAKMLDDINTTNVTLIAFAIFAFVMDYLRKQIESVNKEIISSFGIDPSSEIADDIAKRMEDFMKNAENFVKNKAKSLKDKAK